MTDATEHKPIIKKDNSYIFSIYYQYKWIEFLVFFRV